MCPCGRLPSQGNSLSQLFSCLYCFSGLFLWKVTGQYKNSLTSVRLNHMSLTCWALGFSRRDAWVYSKIYVIFWKAYRSAQGLLQPTSRMPGPRTLKNPLEEHILQGKWFFQQLLILPRMAFVKDFSQVYILISLMQVRNSFIVWTRLSVTEIADHRKAELSLAINIWNRGTNSVFRELLSCSWPKNPGIGVCQEKF